MNLTHVNDDYTKLKQDFEKYGGLAKQSVKNYYNKFNTLKQNVNNAMSKLRQFVSTFLPLFLIKPKLVDQYTSTNS